MIDVPSAVAATVMLAACGAFGAWWAFGPTYDLIRRHPKEG